ncbi:MAG: C10 family peptidase, partial [Muribaculaceae bacterium]|nr:C10 family peptidase [Muribaculaceae bacterium]
MNNFTKSIKRVLMLLVAVLPCIVWAQQVSQEAAKAKAMDFFNHLSNGSFKNSSETPKLVVVIDRSELYVINDEANGGYVVVSGDDRMPEILGFSPDGRVAADNMPCNMRAWLEEYAAQVNYLREHPYATVYPKDETEEREEVPPLLDCVFNQTEPYNNKCPIYPNTDTRCVTGCVATAMAQIMYCHKWPEETADIIPDYTTEALQIDLPEFPITTIDWDNILNQYDKYTPYTDVQADAVATLMLLCGASVQMNYADMSGAWSSDASTAFYRFFAYDNHYEHRSDFTDEDWEQFLYDDLKNGHPVYYSGNSPEGGHAFVIDGYGYEGMPYFHINWGWGGYENDYYLMTNVGGFNNNQAAIMGIQPMDPDGDKIYAVKNNKKITFYYDDQKDYHEGEVIVNLRSCNKHDNITECVFDSSFSKLKFRSLRFFFSGCRKLNSVVGIENLNASEVLCTKAMFENCIALKSLDLSRFHMPKVVNTAYMFNGCSSLMSLDLSNFNTSNVRYMWSMFEGCENLQTIYASEDWNVENVEDGGVYMFFNCYLLKGEKGTRFHPSNTGVEFAHIDGGAENPGYLT